MSDRGDGFYVVRGPPGTRAFVIDPIQKSILDALRAGCSVSDAVQGAADAGPVFHRYVSLQARMARVHPVRGFETRLSLPVGVLRLLWVLATAAALWSIAALIHDPLPFARPLLLPLHFLAALLAMSIASSTSAALQASLLNGRGLLPQRLRLSAATAVPHLTLDSNDVVALPRADRLLSDLIGVSVPALPMVGFTLAGWGDARCFCFAWWLFGLYPLARSPLASLLGDLFGDDDVTAHALHYHKRLLSGRERSGDELALAVCLVACFAWLATLLALAAFVAEGWPAVTEFPVEEPMGVLGLGLTALVMGGMTLGVLASLAVAVRFFVQALGPVIPRGAATSSLTGDMGELLSRNPLLRGMQPSTLERLAASTSRRSMAAGEVLLHQGEEGDTFYIVAQGEVEVERDGRVLKRLGRGDFFGEVALLAHQPRNATVTALRAGELLVVSHDDFWRVLSHDPELGATVEAVAAWRRHL